MGVLKQLPIQCLLMVIHLAITDQRIKAIKLVWDVTGAGLKDSKEAVERIVAIWPTLPQEVEAVTRATREMAHARRAVEDSEQYLADSQRLVAVLLANLNPEVVQ